MGVFGFIGTTLSLGLIAALLTDRSPLASRIAKMLASTVVVLVAVVGAADETWTHLIIAGLMLSWVGDLALSYKGDRWFLVGLVSFALAHVAYTAGFLARGSLSLPWLGIGVALMTVVGLVVLSWLRQHRPDEMAIPLIAYVVIIGVMVAVALATHGGWNDWRIPIAAITFAASDILVARQQFVVHSLANRVAGLPLYFLAQGLFALVVGNPWPAGFLA